MTNSFCGTDNYIPPEIIERKEYNNKCDIWGCGLIMYELCQLRMKFETTNPIELYQQIDKCEFDPIPAIYSQELSDIIFSMIKKNPEERPNASDILNNQSYRWL